jgi:hypothetical protein
MARQTIANHVHQALRLESISLPLVEDAIVTKLDIMMMEATNLVCHAMYHANSATGHFRLIAQLVLIQL